MSDVTQKLKRAVVHAKVRKEQGSTRVEGAEADAIWQRLVEEGIMPHADLITRESLLGRQVVVVLYQLGERDVVRRAVDVLRGTAKGGYADGAFVLSRDAALKFARMLRKSQGDDVAAGWLVRRTHFVARVFLMAYEATFLFNYDHEHGWHVEPGSSDDDFVHGPPSKS